MADRRVPSVPSAVADEVLAEVYAQCAHEIRGSLGLLVAAIEDLEDEGDVPEGALTYLDRGVARLERLAARYSRVAEALDGGLGRDAQPFRLRDVVARARDHVARTTGVVEVLEEGEGDARAVGDADAVAEALGEVLLVASRLTESGRVRVRCEAKDDGAGLVVEPQEPVFEWPPLPRPPTTEGLATRPGLWLAMALVAVQQGEIQRDGDAIRLRLPAA